MWSAPFSFAKAHFSAVLAPAITVMPAALASWITAVPTPPAAPFT
ncbi:MAG: hypothetical protein P8Z76_12550 [Alphaproteobacteria bacterium]